MNAAAVILRGVPLMLVKDIMANLVVTVGPDDQLEDVLEYLIRERFHGAPVMDAQGELVGVVSQQDLFFGQMTLTKSKDDASSLHIRDIMSHPAVSTTEESDIRDVCELMIRLRIHRLPVVRGKEVVGIISSLDICKAISEGNTAF
jgi:CBS domain-containing protein